MSSHRLTVIAVLVPALLLACKKQDSAPTPAAKPADQAPAPVAPVPGPSTADTSGLDLALTLPEAGSVTLDDADIMVLDEAYELAAFKAGLATRQLPDDVPELAEGAAIEKEQLLGDGWMVRTKGSKGPITLVVRNLAGKPLLCVADDDQALGEKECLAMSSPDGKQLVVPFKAGDGGTTLLGDTFQLSVELAAADGPTSPQTAFGGIGRKTEHEEKLAGGVATVFSTEMDGEVGYGAWSRMKLGSKDVICESVSDRKRAEAEQDVAGCKLLRAL